MGELFADMGFIRWPLLFCLLAVIILAAWSTMRLFNRDALADARLKAWVDAILFWGAFAMISGVLGTVVGIVVAANAAIQKSPSASNYGMLAQAKAALGKTAEAVEAADSAIKADSNDPYWRVQKFDILRNAGNYDFAEAAAKEAIAAEDRLSSMPNALPWHVPTDTLSARQWLMQRAQSTEERFVILKGMFERLALFAEKSAPELARVTGYVNIADTKKELGEDATDEQLAEELNATVDEFRQFRAMVETTPIVGETIALAREKQELLFEIGRELEGYYRSVGDSESADAVKARLAAVEEAGVLR
jgi:tetratricopeptide (TPR) repeat protein